MRLGCGLSLLTWAVAFLIDGWRGIGVLALASIAGVALLVLAEWQQHRRDREVAWRRWAEWDVEDRQWRGPP